MAQLFPGTDQHINVDIDTPAGMPRARQKRFLDRADHWVVTGTHYLAVKVLGIGNQGLCVLFRRKRGNPSNPNTAIINNINNANLPSHFVVKQSARNTLQREAMIMKKLEHAGFRTLSGSDHVVRIYRQSVDRQAGTNQHDAFDPSPHDEDGNYDPTREVFRLYMEYCNGGDLFNKVDDRWLPNNTYKAPSEELVWRVFSCLAKAMLLLGDGTENLLPAATPSWSGELPIIHLDVKSDNGKF